jgi:hypothetical protein
MFFAVKIALLKSTFINEQILNYQSKKKLSMQVQIP